MSHNLFTPLWLYLHHTFPNNSDGHVFIHRRTAVNCVGPVMTMIVGTERFLRWADSSNTSSMHRQSGTGWVVTFVIGGQWAALMLAVRVVPFWAGAHVALG